MKATRLIPVHPNPVTDVLSVRIDSAEGREVFLQDLHSRTLSTVALSGPDARIDMKPFAAGTYFLRYTNSTMSRTVKIMKL